MSNVLIKSLRAVQILKEHKFTEEEAREVLESFQGISATKEDLLKTETRLDKQLSLLREDTLKIESSLKNEILNNKIEINSIKTTELKEDIHTLDKKIDQVASTLDKKIDQVASDLKTQITQTSSSQLKWIFGMGC